MPVTNANGWGADRWPKRWASYTSHHDAWRNKAWQDDNPEGTFDWRVIRNKKVIRGWLLVFAPKGWFDEHGT